MLPSGWVPSGAAVGDSSTVDCCFLLQMGLQQLMQIEVQDSIRVVHNHMLSFRNQPAALAQAAAMIEQFVLLGDPQVPEVFI